MRFARMWNSKSPGVETAWRAPARISRNTCSSAGRGGPKSRSHASDPKPTTQERSPSRSRNPTARNNAARSPQNDRRDARLSKPGFSVATRKIAARVSGAATGCARARKPRQASGALIGSPFIWMSSWIVLGFIYSGLISVSSPLFVQAELLCGPEWAAGRHSFSRQAIQNCLRIRVVVRRVGHVLVIVQMHAVNLHVIDIDFPKHWLDVF